MLEHESTHLSTRGASTVAARDAAEIWRGFHRELTVRVTLQRAAARRGQQRAGGLSPRDRPASSGSWMAQSGCAYGMS